MDREFSARLRQVFDFASMAEVGKRLNVPHATVRNYYNGRLPAPEILIKIANETDVSLNWLLMGKGEMYASVAGTREPGRALEALISELIDRRLAARQQSDEELRPAAALPIFDVTTSVKRHNDPRKVLDEWYRFDGLRAPEDFGVVFWQGWETFTTEQKTEAVRDARRVLDRSRS